MSTSPHDGSADDGRSARGRHGRLGPVPYDLRRPTLARLDATVWDPEGSLLSPTPAGVGWTTNWAALSRRLGLDGSRVHRRVDALRPGVRVALFIVVRTAGTEAAWRLGRVVLGRRGKVRRDDVTPDEQREDA